MSEYFDPYHIWLGIPPDEQPANHYRLPGIRAFETNPDVIEGAADRQMAHLRTVQSGKHALLSQRLLNEVSAARICLLNPQTKATYDQQLRAACAAADSAIGRGGPPLPGGSAIGGNPVVRLPVAQPIAAVIPQAAPQPSTNWDQLIGEVESRPRTTSGQSNRSIAVRRAANNRLIYIGLTAVLVLALAGGIVFYALNADSDATLTFNWPAAERRGARLTIDGEEKPLDALALKFPLMPGRHVVRIVREGFQPIDQTIAIGSQRDETISPIWKRQEIANSTGGAPPSQPPPVSDTGDNPTAAVDAGANQKLPVPSDAGQRIAKELGKGQWVDVLRMVDTTRDAVNGSWSRSGAEISCKPKRYSRIKLPVVIDGSYDLEVEFTRTEGTSDVNTIIPIGSRRSLVCLSASDGKASGLERIDGHGVTDNLNQATIQPGTLENGHRYKLLIGVRILNEDMASIDVSLDGRPYLAPWQGKLTSLSFPERWSLPNPRQLGFGGWKDRVTFHSARLRMLAGEALSEGN